MSDILTEIDTGIFSSQMLTVKLAAIKVSEQNLSWLPHLVSLSLVKKEIYKILKAKIKNFHLNYFLNIYLITIKGTT